MLKTFRSSKVVPEKGIGTVLPEEKRPNGEAGIIYDLTKELRSRDLTTCSPEEIETMKKAFADRYVAFFKPEDTKFLDDLFSSLHNDQDIKNSSLSTSSPKGPPRLYVVPFRPKAEVRREIKELADSIEFN